MYNSFYATHLNNQQKLKEFSRDAKSRTLAHETQTPLKFRSGLRSALINALLVFKVR
jgi:hypothetical protein